MSVYLCEKALCLGRPRPKQTPRARLGPDLRRVSSPGTESAPTRRTVAVPPAPLRPHTVTLLCGETRDTTVDCFQSVVSRVPVHLNSSNFRLTSPQGLVWGPGFVRGSLHYITFTDSVDEPKPLRGRPTESSVVSVPHYSLVQTGSPAEFWPLFAATAARRGDGAHRPP